MLNKNFLKMPAINSSITPCIFTMILLVCILSSNPLQAQVEGVMFVKPYLRSITVEWQPNTESDLSHYVLKLGKAPNEYFNEPYYETTETSVQVFLPDSIKSDSIYCAVSAVDSSNLESPPNIIVCVPQVVSLNFQIDDKMRINRADIDKILDLMHDYYDKKVWAYTDEE
ncbi:hypothetical protein JXJ21_11345 [candidate division KSB1 bacterium]|nr:hypothetical protein [candidate division KSB1 bacterium]